MSRRDPRITLAQIRDAAEKARALCAVHTLDSLLADWQATAALERVPFPLEWRFLTVGAESLRVWRPGGFVVTRRLAAVRSCGCRSRATRRRDEIGEPRPAR